MPRAEALLRVLYKILSNSMLPLRKDLSLVWDKFVNPIITLVLTNDLLRAS
jgi:hypothetical protein